MITCPICHSEPSPSFEKHGYWIQECRQCGHRFTDVPPSPQHTAQVYDDHYFRGGEAGYPNYLAEAEIITAHGARYGRLISRYTTPGTVLDVGSAAGFILKGLEKEGWTGQGIEPNDSMAAFARERLGLAVQTGTLEDIVPGKQFDLVMMVQVIAHFYDLRRALAQAAAMTRPGGHWLIESWNKDSWPARLLGQHWHEYSPPSVLHWFSPEGLSQLVAQHGFSEVARGRPKKWLNGAHAKSLLRYKFQDSRGSNIVSGLLQLIPDRLAIPYPTYDLFWSLFQKSV